MADVADIPTEPEEEIVLDDSDEDAGSELALVEDALPDTAADAAAAGESFVELTARLVRLQAEAAAIVDDAKAAESDDGGEPSTALATTGTRSADQVKKAVARTRGELMRKQAEIASVAKELERLARNQLDQANQVRAEMQKSIRRLEETILTVNLYLGRDEEIIRLLDGEPAPVEEPIVIRQMVLAMDEETAIDPEHGGIDALSIEAFDDWLVADPAHLDQVLPESKGVVALVPRFGGKDYDDPWKTAAVEDLNKLTYFLIRNGERVYRTATSFQAGKRLVPAADEFTTFFSEERTDWNKPGRPSYRVSLEPGTDAWLRAEEHADARARHFMRVALILQGLVDRTTVFEPLPECGISFLHAADHIAGRVRFLTDAEHTLSTGRESFHAWQKRLNGELRPGMRIVATFKTSEWRALTWETQHWKHTRLHPNQAAYPKTGALYTIEDKQADGGLVFRYERDEEIYDPKAWREDPNQPGWGYKGEHRKPKTKASCTIYPADEFVIPFDLASVEDMTYFLNSRANRKGYVEMFPILKAAIRAKQAEAVEEAPFRQMLAGVLARDNDVSLADAESAVAELVDWWKLANRKHRPLIGSEEEQGKAVRAISAEHKRRLADAASNRDDSSQVAALLAANPYALLIARKRDGRLLVVSPQDGDADKVYVCEREYARTGRLAAQREWKLVSTARVARWTVLHASDLWSAWPKAASAVEHLSGPEKQASLAQILSEVEADERLLAVSYDAHKRRFFTYLYGHDAVIDDDLPLTGKLDRPALRYGDRGWKRGSGGRLMLDPRGRWWPETHIDGGRYSKEPWAEEELLHVDEALLAHAQAEHARYASARERHSTLWQRANAARRSVEQAWIAVAEEAAHARYLEDYHDDEGWEEYRKTLRIRYPHERDRYSRSEHPNDYETLVERLIESGTDFDGLTVAEAAALGGTDLAEIPEDIRELRFAVPPVLSEPDED